MTMRQADSPSCRLFARGHHLGLGTVVPLDEEAEHDDAEDEGGLVPEVGHCAVGGWVVGWRKWGWGGWVDQSEWSEVL